MLLIGVYHYLIYDMYKSNIYKFYNIKCKRLLSKLIIIERGNSDAIKCRYYRLWWYSELSIYQAQKIEEVNIVAFCDIDVEG